MNILSRGFGPTAEICVTGQVKHNNRDFGVVILKDTVYYFILFQVKRLVIHAYYWYNDKGLKFNLHSFTGPRKRHMHAQVLNSRLKLTPTHTHTQAEQSLYATHQTRIQRNHFG